MTGFKVSLRAYEDWLSGELGEALVAADLREKHRLMREDLFAFLRGSCWRWAELAPTLCPDLMAAPVVGAVVDAHVANFGLWRDAEGRLVWGVNDYDEAAAAPWPLDLVRLTASALIAAGAGRRSAGDIATAVAEGYAQGLADPRPCVLELRRPWLRELVAAGVADRDAFWKKLGAAKPRRKAPPHFARALATALPEPALRPRIAPRRAGIGSLGRLRLVASLDDYRGGPLAREAKALVPSCWDRKAAAGAFYGLAAGAWRAPDPWLRVDGAVVVRRLAPNSRKLELDEAGLGLRRRLLRAMAGDLAAVHAGDAARIGAVRADFAARGTAWLRDAALATVAACERDWRAWRSGEET